MDVDQIGTTPRRERMNIQPPRKSGGNVILWVVLVLLIVAIGGGAFFFFTRNSSSMEADATPTPAEFPTEAPTPTEEEVDLQKYSIQVLNGTEVGGEAGKLKDTLEGAGYKVDGTGNADKSDYSKTIVQAKVDVSTAYLKKLKSELSSSFTLGSDEELEDSNEYDVVIIIGGVEDTSESTESTSSDETPTPTEEATETETPTPSETPAQ